MHIALTLTKLPFYICYLVISSRCTMSDVSLVHLNRNLHVVVKIPSQYEEQKEQTVYFISRLKRYTIVKSIRSGSQTLTFSRHIQLRHNQGGLVDRPSNQRQHGNCHCQEKCATPTPRIRVIGNKRGDCNRPDNTSNRRNRVADGVQGGRVVWCIVAVGTAQSALASTVQQLRQDHEDVRYIFVLHKRAENQAHRGTKDTNPLSDLAYPVRRPTEVILEIQKQCTKAQICQK